MNATRAHLFNAILPWNRKAEPAHFFTLHQLCTGRTVIYCHENNKFYFASGTAMLPDRVPAGTEILCQYVTDCDAVNTSHYLLAFDIYSMGSQSTVGMNATDRYTLLRHQIGPHVGDTAAGCIRIQWAGHFQCVEQVMKGDNAHFLVPHEIGGVFLLKDDRAGNIGFVSAAQFS